MLLDWIILAATFILQFILMPKPQNAKPASLEDFDVPVVEEGKEIGVLSGTEMLKGPNVTWWGDLKIDAIKGPRRYMFFGPRSVIGYRYSLGMQMVLCNGPSDELLEIWVGDKLAWEGISTGGIIHIDKPDLFGGEEREGGIVGDVEFLPGAPSQGRNSYLEQDHVLGANCSAFRGVTTVVLRQVYIGNNTYIKPWAFRVKRIHKKSDGTEQWYDEKAAVPDSHTDVSTETGSQLITGEFMNTEGHIDTNGQWAAYAKQTTAYIWDLEDNYSQRTLNLGTGGDLVHPTASSAGGTMHITEFDEIMFRTGGDAWGTAPTYFEFFDLETLAQSQAPLNTSPYNNSVEINFGFICAERNGYILAKLGPGVYADTPWILLHRSGSNWGIAEAHDGNNFGGSHDHGPLGMSMGPNYAYVRIPIQSTIILVRWNGVWSETAVDLTTELGGRSVVEVGYCESTNEVVVIASGSPNPIRMFVFNEDLTTLLRSANVPGNPVFGMVPHSARMFYDDSNFGIYLVTDKILEINTATLGLVRTLDLSDTSYVNKSNPLASWFLINQDTRGYMIGSHAFATSFWPDTRIDALDMNPAHIIREYLTDPRWAMGYNDSDIDDDSFTYSADLFWDECSGLTIFWVRKEEIREEITIILSHCNAVLYTSRKTGKFVLVPIRNDYVIADLPIFDEDDVIEWTEVKRRQPVDAITSVKVAFTDRRKSNSGKADATWHNDAQIQQLGGIIPDSRNYPGVSRFDLGMRYAERDQHPFNVGMASGAIVGKRKFQDLNPGSPFRLNSIRHNLTGEVLRVVDMGFKSGKENTIAVKWVQDQFRLGLRALVDQTEETWVRPGQAPVAVDPRLVWEMPYFEMLRMLGSGDTSASLATDPDFGMLEVAGEQPTTDTMIVYIYVDGVQTETLEVYSPSGFADGLVTPFQGAVSFTATSNFDLIVVGSLAAFVGATPDAIEIVRITAHSGDDLVLDRGMLDTVPQEHPDGTDFIVFDDFSMVDGIGRTAGDVPLVKLITRTPTGVLGYGAAPSDTVTMDSRAIRPLRPANVTVEGFNVGPVDANGLSTIEVNCVERNRLLETSVFKVWDDLTVAPEAGQTIVIEVLDPAGTSVVTAHGGLTIADMPYAVPAGSFGSNSTGWIRVGAERDGYREWQGYAIEVLVNVETLELDGDPLELDGEILVLGA